MSTVNDTNRSTVDVNNESGNDLELDNDDNSITEALEHVGMLPSFSIPSLMNLSNLAKDYHNNINKNKYFLKPPTFEFDFDGFKRPKLEQMISNKRQELTKIYMELSDSFTEVINSNIHYPVEGIYQEDTTDNESNREKADGKKDISHHDNKKVGNDNVADESLKKVDDILQKYDHLTFLTFEQFNDQYFLRNRIKQILHLDLTPLDQRFLIQRLMSRSFLEKQKYENDDDESEDSSEDEEEDEDEVILTMKDKEPTYFNMEENILGCSHYQRNCKIECGTCRRWYTCRLCHDSEIDSHQLQRNRTRHILCMFCNTPQFPSQYCINCEEELSKYYCDKCILFDNDRLKNIYHCNSCGICRLGLGLNQDYFHCDNCNACISIELQSNHKCIENSTHSNCPICDEYMFHSTKTVVFMLCGHPIHQSCYNEFTKHSYKCPVCSRTVVNMELQFRVLDKEVREAKMPDGMGDWQAIVKCVDCGGKSKVGYHYLGMRCDHCRSYNTMQLKLLKFNDSAGGSTENNNSNPNGMLKESCSGDIGFIENSLDDNFQFDDKIEEDDDGANGNNDANNHEKSNNDKNMENHNMAKNKKDHEDHDTDDDGADDDDVYADNFIRVINNFDKYASISEAFKDWLNASKKKLSGESPKKSL